MTSEHICKPVAIGSCSQCDICFRTLLLWTVTSPMFGYAPRRFEYPRDTRETRAVTA
jgi:hypothetical protein